MLVENRHIKLLKMKKINRKTKGKSIKKIVDSKNSSNLDTSVENSIDEIFRFDDELIGKRTNAVFEQKPVDDGFYDIQLKSNMHSNYSLTSLNDYESLDIYNDDLINEIDEKKNEKMIRMVKAIEMEASQLTLKDLPEIEKLIEENDDFNGEQKGHKNATNRGNNLSVIKAQKISNSKEISTVEKKNPPLSENSEGQISVDPEKSTKSKPDSKSKKKQNSPKPPKSNHVKGNRHQGKLKSKVTSIQQKKDQLIAITNQPQKESTYQRMKREQSSNRISFKKIQKSVDKEKRNDGSNLKVDEKRNKNEIFQRVKKQNPGATYERKRAQSYWRQDEEEDCQRPGKFTVGMKIKPHDENDYCPFGMIRNTRYPQRFRIPPLRGWQNERRNEKDDRLSSITLIDDDYGRQVQRTIRCQREILRN